MKDEETAKPAVSANSETGFWWERNDLNYRDGRLFLAGQDLEKLARSAEQPLFAYSTRRLTDNLGRLRRAMSLIPQSSRILYAMKANRYLPLLTFLRKQNIDGVDVCSPAEVLQARQAGFQEEQISFTGTSVSNADLDILAKHPGVWVNCDSLSMIRRLGERSPGSRKIGLRINPQIGIGYRQNEQLLYAGDQATKFGIYLDRLDEALQLAKSSGLEVTGIHFHAGCGYLAEQLPRFRNVLEEALRFLRKIPNLEHVNLGGGLGIPLVEDDQSLDLEAWSQVVGESLSGVAASVWIEPGDYLVKDAGVMVLEVNTIEEKGGRQFVGVNGGFNLHIEPSLYKLPLVIVPCSLDRSRAGESGLKSAAVVGNINEALDVFDPAIDLPPIGEGDYLAFLNAGGYGSSMSSNHCMRGKFAEYLIF